MRFGFTAFEQDDAMRFYNQARKNGTWQLDDFNWSAKSALPDDLAETAWKIASEASYMESIGMIAAARLLSHSDDNVATMCLATAVNDEAKHSETFAKYAQLRGGSIRPPSHQVDALWTGLETSGNFNRMFLIHTFLEAGATDEFHYFSKVFKGDLLGDIYSAVRSDEARHVALGIEFGRRLRKCDREAFDADLSWVTDNLAIIGDINDDMYKWIGGMAEVEASEVRASFQARHTSRLKQLLA